jgi:hypothetical protein
MRDVNLRETGRLAKWFTVNLHNFQVEEEVTGYGSSKFGPHDISQRVEAQVGWDHPREENQVRGFVTSVIARGPLQLHDGVVFWI